MKKTKLFAGLSDKRRQLGANQSEFWSRFGVTQPCGSRYERGSNMPQPLRILMLLHASGRIRDLDLENAIRALSRN